MRWHQPAYSEVIVLLPSRLVIAVAAAACSSCLLAVPGSAADGRAPRQSALVDARVGDLTTRPSTPGTGERRLTSASVRQDLVAGTVSGVFVLDAEPGASSYLRVTFGRLVGGSCAGELEEHTSTTSIGAGFARSGRTITMSIAAIEAGYAGWDCAFATLASDLTDSPSTYSALVGGLTDVLAQPALTVGSPTLLGSSRLRLVPGVWTTLEVEIGNNGRADAQTVRLDGSGKGLKVKGDTSDYPVSAGSANILRVEVKLTKAHPGKLTLTGTSGAATTSRTDKVKPARAPRPPAPGKYQANGKTDVSFTIARGKVKGFQVRAVTTCGGFPDVPTTSSSTYDFPTTTIPRNGIVDRVSSTSLYSVTLQMRVVGGKVTKGRFSYNQPTSRCRADETFTARRARG